MDFAALPLLGCFVSIILLLVYTLWLRAAGKRLPPGPWRLPLLGSLHHVLLSRHRVLPHRALRELAGTHGPLMLLRFGAVPTLVVSSAEAAREVLKTHDEAFASRYLTPTLAIFSRGGEGFLFSPYNDLWRQLRKICMLELLSARRVQSFCHIREDEAATLLRSIADECARGGGAAVVEISLLMSRMVNDIVVRSAVGNRCPRRDEFLQGLEAGGKLVSGFNLADMYPSSTLARWLGGGLIQQSERVNRNQRDIMADIILRRREGESEEEQEDLLGVLLRLHKDGGVQCALTTDIITTCILDIVGAGSETSSTALEWTMSELVKNPSVLRKAQAEVRDAFQGRRRLTEDDMGRLTYLHLVIKEALRLHVAAPFLLPRQCREPCQVMGYDIPVGTKVLVNAWALGRDGAYWEDAEAFKPERFAEGAARDFKGGDFEFIPFGAGRRICPGMGLGLANMELALASLLYHFDWELPCGGNPEELDMSEAFAITIRRKSKLVLRAVERIPFRK